MTGDELREVGRDVLKREATAWLVHMTSGEATEKDRRDFDRWRAQSRSHAEAFAAASRFWHGLGPAAGAVARRDGERAFEAPSRPGMSRRLVLRGGLAASAIGAAAVTVRPPMGLWPSLSDYAADYRTATGERRRVAVSDGVSVEMNTETSLNLAVVEGGPRIELVSGEAVVTALPSARTLVSVVAAKGRITASEARFNVRCDDDAVQVTCLAGRVDVASGDRQIELEARQQAGYLDRRLQAITRIDPDVITAWQRGMLIFNGAPLRQVLDEVNRYRPGRIVLIKEDVGRRPVTARFRLDALDDVIPQVCQVFGMEARALPGGIVLLT